MIVVLEILFGKVVLCKKTKSYHGTWPASLLAFPYSGFLAIFSDRFPRRPVFTRFSCQNTVDNLSTNKSESGRFESTTVNNL